MSHLNPRPDICDSPPPRWCFSSIQVPRFASQSHPCPISNPSGSQDVCLTYIQALSHLHPGLKILASAPSMYFLSSIQAQKNANQLNPGPYQTHSGLRMCASPPPMSCLTSFQVPKFLSHIHSCTGSFPSRSKDSYLTFIHVQQFHFRLVNYIGISPPNMPRLPYNQDWVLCLAFIQVTFNWHVGHENSISAPF